MNYSQRLLDRLQAATGLPSDGKTAAALGITKQSVSSIKTGRRQFCDETIIKIAHLLEIDPVILVCDKYSESDSVIMRQFWFDILDRTNTAKALEFSGLAANKVA